MQYPKAKKPAGAQTPDGLPERMRGGNEPPSVSDAIATGLDRQEKRGRGRPRGVVPLFQKRLRFDWAAFRAFQKYSKLEAFQAARWAAALTSPHAKVIIRFYTDAVANIDCGYANLDERAAHILKSFNAGADRLSADERLWIETSADKLRLLCSAISQFAWDTVSWRAARWSNLVGTTFWLQSSFAV